jgi:hypothetical protein
MLRLRSPSLYRPITLAAADHSPAGDRRKCMSALVSRPWDQRLPVADMWLDQMPGLLGGPFWPDF